ncbi:MAG: efflux RND transporter periplasmic adaptor subunit [Candidatus Shapirobacteria bacterium]|nr:efflux RND transporter periplasmic adaptor subunit [Candidatus Shapirobacteria bacterium]
MSFLKKNLKKIIIILIVLLVSGFGIYKISAKDKSKDTPKFDVKKETVVTPKRETIKEEITLTGSIDAGTKSNLQFKTSGQLAWVGVKVGDKVKKYQAIASLNKEELKKGLTADFNNYRSALATFDDVQDEYKYEKESLILTDEMKRILVRSQNTLGNAVINYELQDLAIKYATLYTPISGIVVAIDEPNSGVNITPASATFSIIDPTSIYFKAQIDQEDVNRIKIGDKTTIKLDSFPDESIESEVTYISFVPIAGQTSTVYEIRFKLNGTDNQELKYRLGMDGDAIISLKQIDNSLTLPIEAINQDENQSYVFIKPADNDQLIKKNITTGIETDTTIEILEGLSENDQVVISK